LGCAVLHGPHVENFANDYRLLHDENAAIKVPNSVFLANRLAAGGLDPFGQRGRALTQNVTALDALAQRLVGLAR
jgi:3-deoxy-D-manno-octulosonic-acid transferase